jgi:indolepyruvate ferredoxin oxidoreductase beta subunit
MKYDVYLVGVGGQGVLTIADLITRAAVEAGIPANFYPTKGMAQRGGFVKAQVRLGRAVVGPQIPERGADLAIAMERSESLRAVRFIKPGGHFVLLDRVWQPTAVMLDQASYPGLEAVEGAIASAGATLHYLDPDGVPELDGQPVPANVYVLGAAVGRTPLGVLLDPGAVEDLIVSRWKRGVEANRLAFRAGLEA